MGGLRRMRERGRWFGAVAALVLLPSLAPDTFGLSCPHHGGDHATHEANAPTGESHSSPSGHHGHPTPEQPAAPSGGHGPASAPPAPPCTCAGTCPVSPTVTLAARPAPSPVPTAFVGSKLAATTPGHIPVAPRHFQPLANGPPLG